MKTSINSLLLAGLLVPLTLVGCPAGDDTADTETGTAETTGDGDPTGDGDGDPGDGDGDPGDGDGDPGDGDGDGDPGDGDGDPPDPIVYPDNPPEDYTRVDRSGMPAVNSAVIISKDDYNAANPVDDSAATFVPEITMSLTGLHAALDDDLGMLMLTPCTIADCLGQAGPLVIPDTLKHDLEMPAGFPNGRALADPVMDITLAVIMLDLTVMGQDAGTLAGVPINPPANDVAFLDTFPYLADPN